MSRLKELPRSDVLGDGLKTLKPDPRAEARDRADRIRRGLAGYDQRRSEILAAWHARDDQVLGYASWDAYVAAEFATALPREGQRELSISLAAEGMPVRAIAPAVGAGKSTVQRDVSHPVSDQSRHDRVKL
jgi:hypothetical protein